MRRWTKEERKRQADKIRRWQPWKTAGVKTAEGKAISCRNSYKHGGYSKTVKTLKRYLRHCRRQIAMAKLKLALFRMLRRLEKEKMRLTDKTSVIAKSLLPDAGCPKTDVYCLNAASHHFYGAMQHFA